MVVKDIPIAKIRRGPNMRTESDDELGGLMDSFERWGQLQPVMVRPVDGGYYELIFGSRRLAAMQARNERTITCIVRDDFGERDVALVQLVENAQRKEPSPKEYAAAFKVLTDRTPGLTLSAIGKVFGKSSSWVKQKIDADKVLEALAQQGMSADVLEHIPTSVAVKLAKPDVSIERQAKPRNRYDYSCGSGFELRQYGNKAGQRSIVVICKSHEVYTVVLGKLLELQKERTPP